MALALAGCGDSGNQQITKGGLPTGVELVSATVFVEPIPGDGVPAAASIPDPAAASPQGAVAGSTPAPASGQAGVAGGVTISGELPPELPRNVRKAIVEVDELVATNTLPASTSSAAAGARLVAQSSTAAFVARKYKRLGKKPDAEALLRAGVATEVKAVPGGVSSLRISSTDQLTDPEEALNAVMGYVSALRTLRKRRAVDTLRKSQTKLTSLLKQVQSPASKKVLTQRISQVKVSIALQESNVTILSMPSLTAPGPATPEGQGAQGTGQ